MQASSTVTQIEPLGEINDEQVQCFRLKHGDLEATVTSFGATLLSLKFKGKELTLNWDDLESLQDPDKNPKYGATCGRVTGRISHAQFKINDKVFELEANNGPNCLHSGSEGFDQKVWHAKIVQKQYELQPGKISQL